MTTIHMIGNKPYRAPCDAASNDRSTGIPNARIATRMAAPNPARPATWALVFSSPRNTNTTSSGTRDTIAVANKLPPTASTSGWYGVIDNPSCLVRP